MLCPLKCFLEAKINRYKSFRNNIDCVTIQNSNKKKISNYHWHKISFQEFVLSGPAVQRNNMKKQSCILLVITSFVKEQKIYEPIWRDLKGQINEVKEKIETCDDDYE